MIRRPSPIFGACVVLFAACSAGSPGSATSSPATLPTVGAIASSAPTAKVTAAPTPTPELLPSTFTPGGTAPAGAIEVQLGSCCALTFYPYDLKAKAGQVEIFLSSFPNKQNPLDHDMQIGLELLKPLVASPVLDVGEKGLWVIEDLPPANYVFWCSVQSHYSRGMTGTLAVTP
jgi:hypothetical protein